MDRNFSEDEIRLVNEDNLNVQDLTGHQINPLSDEFQTRFLSKEKQISKTCYIDSVEFFSGIKNNRLICRKMQAPRGHHFEQIVSLQKAIITFFLLRFHMYA